MWAALNSVAWFSWSTDSVWDSEGGCWGDWDLGVGEEMEHNSDIK